VSKSPTYILGLSCFYHDSAACLLRDGEVVAAASEERFTRIKQDEDFPKEAVAFCLKSEGIFIDQVDQVVFYEKPILKFERLLSTYIKNWPRGLVSFLRSMRVWLGEKLWMNDLLKKELGYKGEILYVPHHLSHAASSYFSSYFKDSAVITIDGVGEWTTTSIGFGKSNKLTIDQEIVFPHSLGLFYSAFTYYLGFKVNSAEYKVMGLAPYGKPIYEDLIRKNLITIFDDGSFELAMDYFTYEYDLKMVGKKFATLLGRPVRHEDEPLEQFHKDMAASFQKVTEDVVLKMAEYASKKYKTQNLCLSGGVALNCVANGRLIRESKFKNLFVYPAAGDAGGAVGCALYVWHHILDHKERHPLSNIYLGPDYSESEIESLLQNAKVPYVKHSPDEISEVIASKIVENKVVGNFQGRMEFGPRALGNRSILADPRHQENWKRVNLKIKFRESFRPFAPTVLADKISDVYDIDRESPYMLLVAQAKTDSIPATTHVDGSARIQSVNRKDNPLYHSIIERFHEKTGCPVVINTSFNVRGEPIVCSPEDALKCFLRTDIDVLVLGNCLVDSTTSDKKEISRQFDFEVFGKD
jgi:carbamoyltransferase